MADPKKLTDWETLEKMLADNEKSQSGKAIDEQALFDHLRSRVKGQDAILQDISHMLKLQLAMKQHSRPLANLLFLGPTGTGKTELAKAMAEFFFGNESAMLRFDCSEFSSSIAKDRLIGMPTGYVGADQGGQLTRPMLSNPRRIVLFDEIEKAYSGVFDLFLQMMGDGRLTEQGSGRTADFTQAFIVLTSNAEAEKIGAIQEQELDYHEMMNAVKGHLADTKIFRPEILGRIDKVYVFNKLAGPVVAEITLMKISKLAQNFGITVLFVAPDLIMKALEANKKISRFGIRELERIVFEMFANEFLQARDRGSKRVTLELGEDGKLKVSAEAAVAEPKALKKAGGGRR